MTQDPHKGVGLGTGTYTGMTERDTARAVIPMNGPASALGSGQDRNIPHFGEVMDQPPSPGVAMSKEWARRTLNRVKDGENIPVEEVALALKVTGDIT